MSGKEPFVFEYTMPTLDWYTTIRKEVKWDEYLYFKIEYRFGSSYWLIGYKDIDGRFARKEEEIGELREKYLGKFIQWCKYPHGNKLIGISVISTGMNILDMMKKMIEAEGEE